MQDRKVNHRHSVKGMKPAKSAGKSDSGWLKRMIKITHIMHKLTHMRLQDPVFAVNNIKTSFMNRFF